jgi:predicted small metal-binding protein
LVPDEQDRKCEAGGLVKMASVKKVVACRDAGVDCNIVISDSDEEELVALAQSHAKRVHGRDVTPEQVRGIMKQVPCDCK